MRSSTAVSSRRWREHDPRRIFHRRRVLAYKLRSNPNNREQRFQESQDQCDAETRGQEVVGRKVHAGGGHRPISAVQESDLQNEDAR